jgi:hypothetical protein
MKKLNKLQINSEKIIKNEELLILRGGYSTWCCTVSCVSGNFNFSSNCGGWDPWCAESECEAFYEPVSPGCTCSCGQSGNC